MTIQNRPDFYSALLFIAFAIAFIVLAQDYEMGTTRRLGPAYFPTLLGVVQLILGLITLVNAFLPGNADPEPMEATDWKSLGMICASVLLFGQLLPIAGFLLASPALIIFASVASPDSTWKERIISATVLTAACILIFRVGLETPFPVLPPALFDQ